MFKSRINLHQVLTTASKHLRCWTVSESCIMPSRGDYVCENQVNYSKSLKYLSYGWVQVQPTDILTTETEGKNHLKYISIIGMISMYDTHSAMKEFIQKRTYSDLPSCSYSWCGWICRDCFRSKTWQGVDEGDCKDQRRTTVASGYDSSIWSSAPTCRDLKMWLE